MMKKLMKPVAVLAAAVTALSAAAGIPALASQYGPFYYTKDLQGKIVLEGCQSANRCVYVPYKIEGKTVSRIKTNTFQNCQNLRWVILDSVPEAVELDSVPKTVNYFFNDGQRGDYYVAGTMVHSYNFGDYNDDGTVDLLDAQGILQFYTEYTLAGKQMKNEQLYVRKLAIADINRNGVVDLTDAQTVLRYYTEVVSGMPAFPFAEYVYSLNNGPI